VNRRVPLAWLQLKREKLRLLAAMAGVTFGVVLIFVQMGFQDALFDSSVRLHSTLDYGIAIISPKTDTIVQPKPFARSRLYQVVGVQGVEEVTPVYMGSAIWRNPTRPSETRPIFVFGFNPTLPGFQWPGIDDGRNAIRLPDHVLFDELSRAEYGPVGDLYNAGDTVETEINDRRISVAGLYNLGTSFGIDGSLVTSDLNFHRIFPERDPTHVDLGLVQLDPGADPNRVRDRIQAIVPGDVDILTQDDFVTREIRYWNESTAIGFIFGFGVIMGIVVGTIIVYQILFSDVQDSLAEYATLKAMGYPHRYLVGVVMREAVLLACLAYAPAILLTLVVYVQAGAATNLPIAMSVERALTVFGLTVGMCCTSAGLAIRKLRSAQPAEIF
jgi:putative ABC transport system permease protein